MKITNNNSGSSNSDHDNNKNMDRVGCPKGVDASIELRVSHLMMQKLLCILHVCELAQVYACVCLRSENIHNVHFNCH